MIQVYIGFLLASILWFIMFSPLTKDFANFWLLMILSTSILISYSIFLGKEQLKGVIRYKHKWLIIGIASAIILYLIFYLGYYSSDYLFAFTHQQVTNIYSTQNQADKVYIGLALLLWIGPAEEIFWRGFAQHNLTLKYGETKGYVITTLIYALVHIWAFNFMLFMAALICGLFWGWMFKKYKSLVPVIISHSLWDVLIFVIMPIT